MESADSDPGHMTEREGAPFPAGREVWLSGEGEGTVDGVGPVEVKERLKRPRMMQVEKRIAQANDSRNAGAEDKSRRT